MATVSIIVPVYNAQQWLDQCINSIVHQSEQDWQLILVDDGSTDNSHQICTQRAAADIRIRVVSKQNGGLSSARNFGLSHATGKFIYFVDADDQIHSDTLRFLLTIQSHTDADICIGGMAYAKSLTFGALKYDDYTLFNPSELITKILYQHKGYINSACNTLYRASLFHELQFKEGVWYEDLDFFYKIYLRANRIAHTRQTTYHYRQNPHSFINTWSESRLDALTAVDTLVEYMNIHGTSAMQCAAADRRFSAYFNIFALAARHRRRDICTRCWQVIKAYRKRSLLNSSVRPKNRLGAAVSYLGSTITAAITRIL